MDSMEDEVMPQKVSKASQEDMVRYGHPLEKLLWSLSMSTLTSVFVCRKPIRVQLSTDHGEF